MGNQAIAVPNFQNAPATAGSVVVPNYAAFMAKTQEKTYRLGAFVPQPANPYAETMQGIRLPKTGIMKKNLMWCTATFTVAVGTGAVVVKDWMPHNIVKRLQFKGNGADIHSVSGASLHARAQRRNDKAPLTGVDSYGGVVPGASLPNATYTCKFMIEVPLCYSYENGIGAVFAESAGAQYEIVPTIASKSDMFTLTGTADVPTFTFKVEPVHSYWTIPTDNVNGQQVTYVPDLSRLFELQEVTIPITSTGLVPLSLNQANGNCMVASVAWRNNNANVDIANGGLDSVGWNYAGNETPRLYAPTEALLFENAMAYNGRLPFNYFALDFEKENPVRDAIRPRGVTDLNVQLGVPAGTALTASTAILVQELLIAAGNGPAVEVTSAG
jgi:hypothetical protein